MSFQLSTTQQQQPQPQQQPKPLFVEIKGTFPVAAAAAPTATATTTVVTTSTEANNNNDLFKNIEKSNPVLLKEENPSNNKRYSALYGTKVTVLPGYLTGTASMPRGSSSDKRALLKKSSEFRKKPFVNWREGRVTKKTPLVTRERGLQAIVSMAPNLFKQNPNIVTSIDPAIHEPSMIDRLLGRVVRAAFGL